MKLKFHTTNRKEPDETHGIKVTYPPAKRQVPVWRWYLILFTVASPLIYFIFTTTYSHVVITAPGILLLEPQELHASASGFIKHIRVKTGDKVKTGQLIAELYDPVLDEKELRLKRQRNSGGYGGGIAVKSSPRNVQVLQEVVRLTQNVLAERQQKLHTMQKLYAVGATTLMEVAAAKSQVFQARADLLKARLDVASALQDSQITYKPDQQQQQQRQQLETELAILAKQRQQLKQISAHDVRVVEILSSEGEYVQAGALLMQLALLEAPEITAYLEPKFANWVGVGSLATVKFSDGTTLDAKVVEAPGLTHRLPEDLVTTFSARPKTIVVTLVPLDKMPEELQVHGLPLEVRFHYGWEPNWRNVLGSGQADKKRDAPLPN